MLNNWNSQKKKWRKELPRIVERKAYNGSEERVRRLGLSKLWDELDEILTKFDLLVKEEKDSNGGAAVREIIDSRFVAVGGWEKKQTGGVDWTKRQSINGAFVALGVEIQLSGRSDLLIMDVTHLREAVIDGSLDVGVIVVPSDRLATFLTDRCPDFSTAVKTVDRARATDMPIIVLGLEHDGPGEPLEKKKTRQGKGS